MSTEQILEAMRDLAGDHDQLVADEYMGQPCIRCWACERIVWTATGA